MTRLPQAVRESSHIVAPGTVCAQIMPISDQCDMCNIRICLYVLGVIPSVTPDLIRGEARIQGLILSYMQRCLE